MKKEWVSLLASAALLSAGLAVAPAQATPSDGKSGSLFISDEESKSNGNDAHVGCVFTVEWRNFAPNTASTVVFTPSSQGTGKPDSVTVASGNTTVVTDHEGDRRADYMLTFTGTPHATHGFKVAVTASNGTNDQGTTISEHKTIWVTPCDDSAAVDVPVKDTTCDAGDSGVKRPAEPVERFYARAPKDRMIIGYCVLADGKKHNVSLTEPAAGVWIQTPTTETDTGTGQKSLGSVAQLQTAGHHGGHKSRGHKKGGRKGGGHDHGDHHDCEFDAGPDTRVVEYSLTYAKPLPPVVPPTSPSVDPSPSETPSPSIDPSPSETPSPSVDPSLSPTPSPSETPSPSVDPSPSETPVTPDPSLTPTPSPSPSPEVPFDWDWEYPQPDCTQLFVAYPSGLPPVQANDVNIRIRYQDPNGSGERDLTLNFHKEWNDRWNDGDDTSTWGGIKSFIFANHPQWRDDLKSFSVVWVQVSGTNYHWGAQPGDGRVDCVTDGDPKTDDLPQRVSALSQARISALTHGNGSTVAATLADGSSIAGRTVQLQTHSGGAWETIATSYTESNGAVDFFVAQPSASTHRIVAPATFRQSSAVSERFDLHTPLPPRLDSAVQGVADTVAPPQPEPSPQAGSQTSPQGLTPGATQAQKTAAPAQKKLAKTKLAEAKVSKAKKKLTKAQSALAKAKKKWARTKAKATQGAARKTKAAQRAVIAAERKVRSARSDLTSARKGLRSARR